MYQVIFLYDFNNFLFSEFHHPPVNKKLRDYTDNCRANADNGGVKNIFCCLIRSEGKIGNSTYRDDKKTGTIEDEPEGNDKKGKDNHLSKSLTFICVNIYDKTNGGYQSCKDKPFN